jgi:maltose O-acetyltransferase
MDSGVRTEREIMLAGELYNPGDPELVELRRRARALTREINATTEEQTEPRADLFRQLFGTLPGPFEIEPPFRCDYGMNIHAGSGLYINFGCIILDVCEVHIGAGVMMAPNVQLVTATHPIDPVLRLSGRELGKPIRIGNRVWLGAGVIVLPGVTIGDDTTIGAGSVVTRDIPPRVVAVGNPCRVLRSLD